MKRYAIKIPVTHDAIPFDTSIRPPDAATPADTPHDTKDPAITTRYDLRILRAMRQMIHYVDLYSKQIASIHRITTPQLVCLLTVVEKAPTTATAIGREIQLSASTVVGILDRLEEKRLITRERDRIDRRLVFIRATLLGTTLAQNAPSPLQATLASLLSALPEGEQATIAGSLERIAGLMAAQRLDGAMDTYPRSDHTRPRIPLNNI